MEVTRAMTTEEMFEEAFSDPKPTEEQELLLKSWILNYLVIDAHRHGATRNELKELMNDEDELERFINENGFFDGEFVEFIEEKTGIQIDRQSGLRLFTEYCDDHVFA